MPINKRTDGHTVAARNGERSASKRNELLLPATAWMGSDHRTGQRQSARGECALCDPLLPADPDEEANPLPPGRRTTVVRRKADGRVGNDDGSGARGNFWGDK